MFVEPDVVVVVVMFSLDCISQLINFANHLLDERMDESERSGNSDE